jgi:ankyrin repeat protein
VKRLIITITFLIAVLAFGFFTVPLPMSAAVRESTAPSTGSQTLPFNPGVEKCPAKTLFYEKRNGYTDAGEGVIDPRCRALQIELGRAVDSGNLDAVRQAISGGANPESPNNDYELYYSIAQATWNRNTEMIALLLDNGADVNHYYSCCMTHKPVLQIAIENGDLDSARLLLSRGAQTDYLTGYEKPPMTIFDAAGESRSFEMIQLIDNSCGYDVSCRAKLRLKILEHWGQSFLLERSLASHAN